MTDNKRRNLKIVRNPRSRIHNKFSLPNGICGISVVYILHISKGNGKIMVGPCEKKLKC